mgnify:FL=1
MAGQPTGAQADTTLKARDLLWLCLSRWYWFVISLAVCCGGAVYYILKTSPVYERSASILIKDDRLSGTTGGDVGQAFTGMGFLQANTNVLNELVSITSPTVMWEVSRRLGLDVGYTTAGMFHDRVLYGSDLPVRLSFPGMGEKGSGSLTAVVNPDGTVKLEGFADKEGPIEGAEAVTGSYERLDTVMTPLGDVAIAPNPAWKGGKLTEPLEINVTRTPLSVVARRWAGALSAEKPEDYATVIALSLSDVSTQRAEDILNAVIDVYNENWIKDKNRIAVSTSDFIRDRLAVIESELGNVDSDISSYKSTHMVPDVEQASQLYFSRAAAASDEVAGLNNRLAMARYIRDYLTNSANSFNVLPANAGLENLNIETQISGYNTRLLERNNLVENSSTQNPLVVDMDNQLAGMRQAILQSIDNYVVTLNSQVRTAEHSQAAASSRLQANPSQARYLLSVERQQKVKESLYLYLLQKREENELSQAFTAYNTRVINPPMGSDLPVAPNRRNVMLVAVLLGLLIPLGAIYLSETLNSKVRGRKDLESLSVPFVGEIPLGYRRRRGLALLRKAHDDEKDRRVVMVRKGSGNTINEAFRVIRTNLELMTDAEASGAHVIMVSSANPGSGKTFITMNLATVLAIKGKRVAVVDLDLRKASLSAYAGSPAKGVSAYLSGHATAQEIMVKNVNGTEGLDLIPVGALPPNPAELLYSPRLKALIDDLKGRYDYVLLDCPPVEVVADAKIINRYADLTLFVVRAGLLEREMLPHIQQFYDSGRYHNLAIVLNGTETSHLCSLRSTYGYGYGYGYGYHSKGHTDGGENGKE